MDLKITQTIELGDEKEITKRLQEFISKYENNFSPVGFSRESFIKLWNDITHFVRNSTMVAANQACLSSLRILSRDKVSLCDVVNSHNVDVILKLADLVHEDDSPDRVNNPVNYDVVYEAQKLLNNIILNNSSMSRICSDNSYIPGLMNRLKRFRDTEIPHNVKYFDLRLLFLISALAPSVRSHLDKEYHCISCLTDILDSMLEVQRERQDSATSVVFEENKCKLLNEILKVLYNLVLHIDRTNTEEEDERHCCVLITVLRKLLLSSASSIKMTEELHSNAINLLLVLPPKLYSELLQAIHATDAERVDGAGGVAQQPHRIVEYDGKDMSAVVKILEFLHTRLKTSDSSSSSSDSLMPVLTLMVEMTLNHRIIRKFIRLTILPPLRDATKRPEEGETIKSRLCSLMTSPAADLKHLSANFLFILCKENVERLIKYTGYGNAAGLLASRGLMLGGGGGSLEFSSDSEDSETEEYELLKDQINPVTGRYEPPRPTAFDQMTDEQKEHEAMELVKALDKLTSNGIIQPCRIREDGRPHPVDCILELRPDSFTNDRNSEEEN